MNALAAVFGMEGAEAFISVLGAIILALLAMVLKPGQQQVLSVDVAEKTVNAAGDTVQMSIVVSGQMREHLERLSKDLDALRKELADVKKSLSTVTAERDTLLADNTKLLAENTQLRSVHHENVKLKARVEELEDRVRSLESA